MTSKPEAPKIERQASVRNNESCKNDDRTSPLAIVAKKLFTEIGANEEPKTIEKTDLTTRKRKTVLNDSPIDKGRCELYDPELRTIDRIPFKARHVRNDPNPHITVHTYTQDIWTFNPDITTFSNLERTKLSTSFEKEGAVFITKENIVAEFDKDKKNFNKLSVVRIATRGPAFNDWKWWCVYNPQVIVALLRKIVEHKSGRYLQRQEEVQEAFGLIDDVLLLEKYLKLTAFCEYLLEEETEFKDAIPPISTALFREVDLILKASKTVTFASPTWAPTRFKQGFRKSLEKRRHLQGTLLSHINSSRVNTDTPRMISSDADVICSTINPHDTRGETLNNLLHGVQIISPKNQGKQSSQLGLDKLMDNIRNLAKNNPREELPDHMKNVPNYVWIGKNKYDTNNIQDEDLRLAIEYISNHDFTNNIENVSTCIKRPVVQETINNFIIDDTNHLYFQSNNMPALESEPISYTINGRKLTIPAGQFDELTGKKDKIDRLGNIKFKVSHINLNNPNFQIKRMIQMFPEVMIYCISELNMDP